MNRPSRLFLVAAAFVVASGAALAQDIEIKVPLPPVPKISIPKPPMPKLKIESRDRDRDRDRSPSKPVPPDRHRRRYDYYPDAQVYFDPARQLFFFLQANEWIARQALPPDIRGRIGASVHIDLDSDRPWDYHDDIRRLHPGRHERTRYSYRAGFDDGYEEGYGDGYDKGYRAAYEHAYREGYRDAYRRYGRDDRREDRRDERRPPGYDRGNKEGFGKHD